MISAASRPRPSPRAGAQGAGADAGTAPEGVREAGRRAAHPPASRRSDPAARDVWPRRGAEAERQLRRRQPDGPAHRGRLVRSLCDAESRRPGAALTSPCARARQRVPRQGEGSGRQSRAGRPHLRGATRFALGEAAGCRAVSACAAPAPRFTAWKSPSLPSFLSPAVINPIMETQELYKGK